MTVLLAAPLDRFVAAVNAGDTAAFLACFAPDAVVDDWGRSFAGHAAIRGWSDRELIGARGVLTVRDLFGVGGAVTLRGHWASKVFTGESSFGFIIADGLIRSLRISG